MPRMANALNANAPREWSFRLRREVRMPRMETAANGRIPNAANGDCSEWRMPPEWPNPECPRMATAPNADCPECDRSEVHVSGLLPSATAGGFRSHSASLVLWRSGAVECNCESIGHCSTVDCSLGAVALWTARWALWRCGAVEWHYRATALNTVCRLSLKPCAHQSSV